MVTLKKSFKAKRESIKQSILETGIPLKNCEPPAGYRAVCSNVGPYRGGSEIPTENSLKFCISKDNERERIWLFDDNKSTGFRVMTLQVEKKESDHEWIATIKLNPDSDSYEQMKNSLKTQGWGSI